jgi:hypothetical protein
LHDTVKMMANGRQHWQADRDGFVRMTRGGYPHQVHVTVLDAIAAGDRVASCIQELWAANDLPIPAGYTGHGKTGTRKPGPRATPRRRNTMKSPAQPDLQPDLFAEAA